MDHILLEDMEFMGYCGVDPHERHYQQPLLVSLSLGLDLTSAGSSDCLEDTLDYSAIYQWVEQLLRQRRFALLEALAEAIARQMLTYPRVQEVAVKVGKKHPPLPGKVGGVAVQIIRRSPVYGE